MTKIKTSSTEEQFKQVVVDPNTTVSCALALALKEFGFKNESDTEGEEYGFTIPEKDSEWLDEMKKLGEYRNLFTSPNLSLRRKPWLLKVYIYVASFKPYY